MVIRVRTHLGQINRMWDNNIQKGAKIVQVETTEQKRKREARNFSKTRGIVIDLEEVERLARLEVLGMEDWQDRSRYNWQEKAKKDITASLKSKKKVILKKLVRGKAVCTDDIIMPVAFN